MIICAQRFVDVRFRLLSSISIRKAILLFDSFDVFLWIHNLNYLLRGLKNENCAYFCAVVLYLFRL